MGRECPKCPEDHVAEGSTQQEALSVGAAVGGGATNEPSIRGALPYFAPIAIFPLVVSAAMYGGWWLAGPFIFVWLADQFDTAFGEDERNMDPRQPGNRQLFWYKLAVWIWVALYPITFVFAFRQVFVADYLAVWEDVLIVLALGAMARMTLNAGHDMMHRRAVWERRVGEFLMASVSFPQEITEHIYVHHAHIGTPRDSLSPPKGQSFWQYLPRSVARSYLDAWRLERDRMTRRRLPIWHHTNLMWRYFLETAAWYAVAYWIGGAWGLLVFAIICAMGIFQLRMADYIQHYGLQRIRLPGGRFERVRPRHSWSAAYKLSNWLYYNSQRHADHHLAATRLYPLLQHCGAAESPQLPGSYSAMGSLIMSPRRWFRKMDPLVDQWRAHFYPHIDDWSAYDSPAYKARPDAFEAIAEILGTAPSLAAWMNRNPELLDGLRSREFTDLDLPGGFGPDPEFEAFARRGLARVYWTHELDVAEMRERIADTPVQSVREAVEATRNWSNDKVFQIGVHTLRGNLSPVEAGTALSNIAEASIAAVLSAVEEDFANRSAEGGVAVAVLGDLASREAAPGVQLDVMFVYEGGPAAHYDTLCRRFLEALRALSRDNLLFAAVPREGGTSAVRSLADFSQHHRTTGSASELLDLARARCVFACGDSGVARRFDEVRLDVLTRGPARCALIAELRETPGDAAEPGSLAVDDIRGGLRDIERTARFLQLNHAAAAPEILAPAAVSAFRTAGAREFISAAAAERLVEAATMWRNLRGILRLVADDGFSAETAAPGVKAVIARSCGSDDFDALTAAIRSTAAHAACDIDAVTG